MTRKYVVTITPADAPSHITAPRRHPLARSDSDSAVSNCCACASSFAYHHITPADAPSHITAPRRHPLARSDSDSAVSNCCACASSFAYHHVSVRVHGLSKRKSSYIRSKNGK
ncbi:hypothetical protein J6590_064666 [Homalodisca vitripennis]|nr:hypothetical protein J6590_064666 [Homalodisca vitripennis]